MNNNKEIDLIEFFIKILFYTKKYKWIFIVAIVLAIGLSIYKTNSQMVSYTSSMLLKVNDNNENKIQNTNISFKIYQKNTEQNSGELISKVINSAETYRINDNINTLINRMKQKKKILNQYYL